LDFDDNGDGLREKLQIAVKHGFRIFSDAHQGFSAKRFIEEITFMIENDQARGAIVILDVYKKFTNVMDKTESSRFNQLLRRFVLVGGTALVLGHTNKNLGANGKPVHGGTSDSLDDADAAYLMISIPSQPGSSEKVIQLESLKRRGINTRLATYRYSVEDGLSYDARLASMQPVNDAQLPPSKQAAQVDSDAELIQAIETLIKEGVNVKMALAQAAAKRVGASKREAIDVIDRFTGDSPDVHRWTYSVRARGAQVFELLAMPSLAPTQPSVDS